MNFFWEDLELKNEDRLNSALQISWMQMNCLVRYLAEKRQFVIRQQTVGLVQEEDPPYKLFENPGLPLDKAVRPLALREEEHMDKQAETRLFGDFHNVIKLCVCDCVCERESLL